MPGAKYCAPAHKLRRSRWTLTHRQYISCIKASALRFFTAAQCRVGISCESRRADPSDPGLLVGCRALLRLPAISPTLPISNDPKTQRLNTREEQFQLITQI